MDFLFKVTKGLTRIWGAFVFALLTNKSGGADGRASSGHGRPLRLVIVGNAPLPTDCSEFIDSCDCVVRFNDCKNYGEYSGGKTDILVVNCIGHHGEVKTLVNFLRPRSDSEIEADLPFVNAAREVWFARPDAASIQAFFETKTEKGNRFLAKEMRNLKTFGICSDILIDQLKIPEQKVRYVSGEFHAGVWDKLLDLGETEAIFPSTGLIGIEMVLDHPGFKNHEKWVLGFGWEGWPGHAWELEHKLLRTYLESGLLHEYPVVPSGDSSFPRSGSTRGR